MIGKTVKLYVFCWVYLLSIWCGLRAMICILYNQFVSYHLRITPYAILLKHRALPQIERKKRTNFFHCFSALLSFNVVCVYECIWWLTQSYIILQCAQKSTHALIVLFCLNLRDWKEASTSPSELVTIMRMGECNIIINGKTIRIRSCRVSMYFCVLSFLLSCMWMVSGERWAWPSKFAYIFCSIPFSAIWLHYNISSFNFLLVYCAATFLCVFRIMRTIASGPTLYSCYDLCVISIRILLFYICVVEWL